MVLSELTCERFRQQLAGLLDPDAMPDSASVKVEIRELAARIVCVLARHMGEAIDRKTLWSRIDSGIQGACVKCNGDLQRFLDLCLEHVDADPGIVTACDALLSIRETFRSREAAPNWARQLLDYFLQHRYAALQFGKARWEQVKAKAVEL